MKKNTFERGYEIVWVGHCRAHLAKFAELPIVEFYKSSYLDSFTLKSSHAWSIRPLAMTDEKIDFALPNNWRDKTFFGFKKFVELLEWLESQSSYLRND